MPAALRRVAILAAIYLAAMTAAALWLPHEWDWSFFQWMSAHSPPMLSRQITIVDMPWDTKDVPTNRKRVAAFIAALTKSGARPAALILDIEFDPCQTQPCDPAMEGARRELARAIGDAARVFPVFATEEPQVDREDEVIGPLDPHDDVIYDALTGAAHTRVGIVPNTQGVFYRSCYADVEFTNEAGQTTGTESVWSMVNRVLPEFSASVCDPTRVAIRMGAPLAVNGGSIFTAGRNGTLPGAAQFDKQYVIVGTLEYDRSEYTDRSGPELLAWALSNSLEFGTAVEPENERLLVLVPAFSLLSVLGFAALFYPIKRTRLRSFRHRLPIAAAAIAACVGLAAFAAFEAFMYAVHQIHPQVSLVVTGIVVSATLCGYAGHQILNDELSDPDAVPSETHDYDVFISYAHEEGAWVAQHVYSAFRNATRSDGSKLSIFFDTESIQAGTSWQTKLALAIDGSRFIVPVYSNIYFTKPYCKFEIMRAHRKWVADPESRCVLPIMRGHPKILAAVDDIQALSIDDHPDLVQRYVADVVASIKR